VKRGKGFREGGEGERREKVKNRQTELGNLAYLLHLLEPHHAGKGKEGGENSWETFLYFYLHIDLVFGEKKREKEEGGGSYKKGRKKKRPSIALPTIFYL